MNVMLALMTRQLSLQLHPLLDIGFAGMMMRTVNNQETHLTNFVYLEIRVTGVW